MLVERRSAFLLLAVGLGVSVLAACSSSSPEVGAVESSMDLEDQLQNVNRTLAEDSTDIDAYLRKARLLRQKADSSMGADRYIELYEEAVAAEEKALAIDDDVQEDLASIRQKVYAREKKRGEKAYNQGGKDEKEALFQHAIGFLGAARVTQSDSAAAVLSEAYARLRVGQKEEARPVLEEYVQRADTVALRAYKILGQMYVSAGEVEKAEKLLDQGIKTYPDEQSLQALRLNAYNRAGDVDEALAAYREQIERTPDRPSYLYNYGALLLKAKRYDDAIEQLTRAVDLRGDNAEGQYNLGAAYLNAALARDDSIAMIEQDSAVVQDTSVTAEEELDRLADKRQELFEQAIPPLERARKIVEEDRVLHQGQLAPVRQDACRALMVAYVQTDRSGRAADVEDCTGFARTEE